MRRSLLFMPANSPSMLQNSRNIVSSVPKHETLITEYSEAYSYFNPEFANAYSPTVVI